MSVSSGIHRKSAVLHVTNFSPWVIAVPAINESPSDILRCCRRRMASRSTASDSGNTLAAAKNDSKSTRSDS